MKVILDLCGGTGAWSRHYRENGYRVVIVDPLADDHHDNYLGLVEDYCSDVFAGRTPFKVQDVTGILCAPPCTQFSGSGARWWADKDTNQPELLEEGMNAVLSCIHIVEYYQIFNLSWWALENPVGRMRRIIRERRNVDIGEYRMTFNPCDYGDPYTKRTCIWGDFTDLRKTPVEPTEGSKIHLMSPSDDRWRLRSMTPPGFARAFYEANP